MNCNHDFIPEKIWRHRCQICNYTEYEKVPFYLPKVGGYALLVDVQTLVNTAKSDICWNNEDLNLKDVIYKLDEILSEFFS